MATPESWVWEQDRLGEPVEYPGHPLVLATMVLDRYTSLDAAADALGDSFIIGSGCAVRCAMDVLEAALSGNAGALESAYVHAEHYWNGWATQTSSDAAGVTRGRVQADRMRPTFMRRLADWKGGSPVATKYARAGIDVA